MGVGPAMVAWWANVNKSNFQLVCRRSGDHTETQQRSEHYCGQFDEVLHLHFPPIMVRILRVPFYSTFGPKWPTQTGRGVETNFDRIPRD